MAGLMEVIKENLSLHHGVVKASLTYIIQKTITVQTYGDYSLYATPDDKMIIWILKLSSDKNKLFLEMNTQTA